MHGWGGAAAAVHAAAAAGFGTGAVTGRVGTVEVQHWSWCRRVCTVGGSLTMGKRVPGWGWGRLGRG